MNTYVILFIVFSVMGWIWESIYCSACEKKWANRGFLYGPLCPIYGFGGIMGLALYQIATLKGVTNLPFWMIFLVGFVVSMVLEYPTSYVLEKLFHARWWDYSNVPLNINGRTSVPTSIAFGAAAILVMKMLIPFFAGLVETLPGWGTNLAALVLVGILSCDFTLTVSALTDFQRRVKAMDDNFQNHMTDAVASMIQNQNRLHLKAVQRISKVKFTGDKLKIADLIKSGKLHEVVKDMNLHDRIEEYFADKHH